MDPITTAGLKVHSFHICPGGSGDAAIHLLVDESTAPKPAVYRAVLIDGGLNEQAQTNRNKDMIDEIEEVYQADPQSRFGATATGWLKFDAIIITHFDEDHWGGVYKFLQKEWIAAGNIATQLLVNDINNAYASAADPFPPNGCTPAAVQAWVDRNDAVTKAINNGWTVQNPRMKYATDNPAFHALTAADCRTTFYLPYTISDSRTANITNLGPRNKTDGVQNFYCWAGYNEDDCWKANCNLLGMKIKLAIPNWNVKETTGEAKIAPSTLLVDRAEVVFQLDGCKVVANDESYLGVEVFESRPLPGGHTWDTIENPGKLVMAHELTLQNGPRMYIVAGNQYVLGNAQLGTETENPVNGSMDPFLPTAPPPVPPPLPPLDPPSTSKTEDLVMRATSEKDLASIRISQKSIGLKYTGFIHPVEDIIDTGAVDGYQGWAGNKREKAQGSKGKSHAKNAPSICCMVFAATGTVLPATGLPDEANSFKALHFTGGDLLWDVETAVATWAVSADTVNVPPKPLNIEVLKISHHGGNESTSVALLKNFRPKRFIVSMSDGNGNGGSYGHPRWELVLYLAAAIRTWMRQDFPTGWTSDSYRRDRAMYLLNVPPYLAYDMIFDSVRDVGSLDAFQTTTSGKAKAAYSVYRACLEEMYATGNITNPSENVMSEWMAKDLHNSMAKFNKASKVKPAKFTSDEIKLQREELSADLKANMRNLVAPLIAEFNATWDGTNFPRGFAPDSISSDKVRCIEVRLSAGTTPPARVWAWKGPKGTGRPNYTIPVPPPLPALTVGLPKDEMSVEKVKKRKRSGSEADTGDDDESTGSEGSDDTDGGAVKKPKKDEDGMPEDFVVHCIHHVSNLATASTTLSTTSVGSSIVTNFTETLGGVSGVPANQAHPVARPTTLDTLLLDDPTVDDDCEGGYFGSLTSPNSTSDEQTPHVMGAHLALMSKHTQVVHLADPFTKLLSKPAIERLEAVTSDSAPYFRIYCTDYLDDTVTMSSNEAYLDGTANQVQNAFVTALLNGVFTCQPPSDPGHPNTYVLLNTDEMLQRLQSMTFQGVMVQSLCIIGTVSPVLVAPAHQTMQIQEIQANITIGTATILFSSANTSGITSVCGLPASNPLASGDAFIPSRNILCLGISSPTSVGLVSLLMPGSRVAALLAAFVVADVDNEMAVSVNAAAGSRSAFSIQAGNYYRSWLRLELLPPPAWRMDKVLGFLQPLGVTFTNSRFILRQAVKSLRNDTHFTVVHEPMLFFTTDMSLMSLQTTVWWIFGDNPTLTICFTKEQGVDQIFSFILALLNTNNTTNSTPGLTKDNIHPKTFLQNVPIGTSDGASFYIQQLSLTVSPASGGSHITFQITFEIDLFGTSFILTISGPPVRFSASLWTHRVDPTIWGTDANGSPIPYLPYLEDYMQIQPFGNNVKGFIDLGQIIGGDNKSSKPLGISAQVTRLDLEVELLGSVTTASIQSMVVCTEADISPNADDTFPDLGLGTLFLSAFLSFDSSADSSKPSYDVMLEATLLLFDRRQPPPAVIIPPASLAVEVEANNGVWTVSAEASDLQFGALYEIFDHDANESIADILGHLSVPELSVVYTYDPAKASTFVLNGSLIVGPLELELYYQYIGKGRGQNPSPKSWVIQAHLGLIDDTSHKLGDIITELDSTLGGILNDVPFVRDCTIPAVGQVGSSSESPRDDSTGSGSGYSGAPVQLLVTSDGVSGLTLMAFRLEIDTPAGSISCMLIRWKSSTHVLADGETRSTPKLLLKVAVDRLPSLPKIPVVGSLPQPVDSIDYIYVKDSDGAASATGVAGITLSEMSTVNEILQNNGFDLVPFRQVQSDVKSDNATGNPGVGSSNGASNDSFAILAGHHFIVVAEEKTIIDHVFGGSGSTKSSTTARTQTPNSPTVEANVVHVQKSISQISIPTSFVPVVRAAASNNSTSALTVGTASASNASQADSGTTHGAMKKSFGPLTISNVGIQVKGGFLYLVLDFTVALGPVQLTAVGFGLGVSLSAFNLNALRNITLDDFSIIIPGISVYCDVPPVMIAGVFIHQDNEQYELYEGGLAVSILPYTLLAVGAYRKDKIADFKSVFVFARFDGPLLSLEFAEISGVEAGFGYNYALTMPSSGNLLNFPLLHSQTGTNTPMDILDQFGVWSTPKNNEFWFAVGCKVDAFEVLSIDAAIMITFGVGNFAIGIAGLATASMPPMVKERNEAVLYVELGIIAALDVLGGSLRVEAQLTPNSFILYPDCHLTGGAALCYWFVGSPYAGDFVFTVGGYHPAFKPPSYYPPSADVPRVGISWNLSDVLTIQGGAFFAITPKAAMAGGSLHAVFQAWIVYASLDIWAYFLVNFSPFFFTADIGVSVSCGVHISIGLIDIYITADISAGLHLQGPLFGGTVYVDLKVHTFSIDFGDTNNDPGPLSWPEFLKVVIQTGPKTTAVGDTNTIIVAIVSGSVNEKTTSTQSVAATTDAAAAPSEWFVRAGQFSFRVESKIPVDQLTIGDGGITASRSQIDNPSAAYARLMRLNTALSTQLTVTVAPVTAADDFGNGPWKLVPMLKNLPLALWDKYDASKDPTQSGNNISDTLNASSSTPTASHCVGYIIQAPDPTLPSPALTLPEFNAAKAMEEGVFTDGGTPARADRRPLLPLSPTDTRPRIPPCDGTAAPEFLPVARPTGANNVPLQNTDLWNSVKNTWASADFGMAQLLADAWTDVMGWADAPAQIASNALPTPTPATAGAAASTNTAAPAVVYPVPLFTPLLAEKPAAVLEQFDSYFLGLPQVATGIPVVG